MWAVVAGIIGGLIVILTPSIRRFFWGPELEIIFEKDREGFVILTPIILTEMGNVQKRTEGFYVRVMVRNIKDNLAKECRCYLVNVDKITSDGEYKPTIYCDSLQLQWSCRPGKGFDSIDLPRDIPQFIDVIATIKDYPYF